MEHLAKYTICWTAAIAHYEQQYYSDLNIGLKISQHNPNGIDLFKYNNQIKIAIEHVIMERITKYEPQG